MPRIAASDHRDKHGRPFRIRSAEEHEAAAVLDFLRSAAATTDQIASYPDEFPKTVEAETQFLRGLIASDRAFNLIALVHHAGQNVDAAVDPAAAAPATAGRSTADPAAADRAAGTDSARPCIIGCLTVTFPDKRRMAHCGTLGIMLAEDFRGAGIGRALMQRAIRVAEDNPHVEKLSLCVFDTNAVGLALYRSLGFFEEGRLLRAARFEDGRYADDILMARWTKPQSGL